MAYYVAVIRKDPDSDFGVDFPDFPGCGTGGSTIAEAIRMAEEALLFHIEGMIEDGEEIPAGSDLEAVQDITGPDVVTTVVLKLPDLTKVSKRVLITVPVLALERIDAKAAAQGKNRSAFLVESALRNDG